REMAVAAAELLERSRALALDRPPAQIAEHGGREHDEGKQDQRGARPAAAGAQAEPARAAGVAKGPSSGQEGGGRGRQGGNPSRLPEARRRGNEYQSWRIRRRRNEFAASRPRVNTAA